MFENVNWAQVLVKGAMAVRHLEFVRVIRMSGKGLGAFQNNCRLED